MNIDKGKKSSEIWEHLKMDFLLNSFVVGCSRWSCKVYVEDEKGLTVLQIWDN